MLLSHFFFHAAGLAATRTKISKMDKVMFLLAR